MTSTTGFSPADSRAVASVATQFFMNGAIFASFVPRLPEIRDRLDVSIAVLGGLMTTAGIAGLGGSFIVSRVIERFGTRQTLITGSALLMCTLLIIGFSTTPVMFVIGLGLMGVFDVIVDVAMNLQGSWLSARRHTPIMNRLHGLWSLGTVVGGLAAVQITAAGVSLERHVLGVAVLLFLALIFVGRGLLTVDEETPEASSPGTKATSGPHFGLLAIALASGFAIAVEIVSSDWAAFRLSDDFGTSASFAGLGFVAFTLGMTLARFGGDSLLQRVGPARLNQLSVVAAAVGLTAAALVPNRFIVLAAYMLAGIGISTFFPRLYDTAAQMPGRKGAGLGALTAGSRVAALVMPALVGGLAATSLSVGTATALVVIPSVLGFAAITLRGAAKSLVAAPTNDR